MALTVLKRGLGGFGGIGTAVPVRTVPFLVAAAEKSIYNRTALRTKRQSALACPPDRDIVLVVDSSESVGRDKFHKALDDLSRLIPYLCGFQPELITDCRSVRLALVTYGSEPRLVFDLNHSKVNHTYQTTVQNDIKHLPRYLSLLHGRTATGDALQFAADRVLQERYGMRSYSNRTILLLTDGKSNRGRDPVEVANRLYSQYEHLSIVALGIGDKIDYDELENVTNHHKGLENLLVLYLHSHEDFTTIVNEIIKLLQRGQSKCEISLLDKRRK